MINTFIHRSSPAESALAVGSDADAPRVAQLTAEAVATCKPTAASRPRYLG